MLLTTAALPATMLLDPTAPHVCGRADCPDSATSARSDAPEHGVASNR